MRTKVIGVSNCKKCGARNDFTFYSLDIIPDKTSLSLERHKYFFVCTKCEKENFIPWNNIPESMKKQEA